MRSRVEAETARAPSFPPARFNTLQHAPAGRCEFPALPSIVREVLGSPGRPLDPATRAFMEPRFGHDFGRVRVHTDARAAESAQAVNALAYTVGRDVVFGEGRYEPGTTAGQRLLAHELTHMVQQGSAASATPAPLAIGAPASPAEREAEQAADQVTQGGWGAVSAGAESGTLQRQEADDDERRLHLQEPEFGQSPGLGQLRPGLDLPKLQLDPQLVMQIRAMQFARGLLPIEDVVAAEQIASGGPGSKLPGTPGTAPGLVPSPGQPQGGGTPPAGGLGQPGPGMGQQQDWTPPRIPGLEPAPPPWRSAGPRLSPTVPDIKIPQREWLKDALERSFLRKLPDWARDRAINSLKDADELAVDGIIDPLPLPLAKDEKAAAKALIKSLLRLAKGKQPKIPTPPPYELPPSSAPPFQKLPGQKTFMLPPLFRF